MLNTTTGWMLGFCSIAIVWIVLLIRKGPILSLGPAMILSFAFPVWVKLELFGMPFTVRTAIACVTMLGFAVHPKGKIISPLTLLDVVIGFMCLTHIASDANISGFTPVLPFRAYGEWVLPYVAGRYAIRDRHDLRWISPWIIGVLLLMGITAIIESVTKINPYEVVFGNRPEELAGRSAQRFGLKRAFGMVTHPIYFGMLISVLSPWIVSYWQDYHLKKHRVIAVVTFLITLAGAVCTVSRTPVLTILIGIGILLSVRYRFIRWPFCLSAAAAIIVFAMFPNQVIDKVSALTGGGDRLRLIEVDGKAVTYSSSRSRLIVLQTYSGAVVKAGLLGYGSEAVSSFPPQIPYMQGKAELSNMMKLVDNGYILISLRFGWLGGICLVLIFVSTIFTGFLLFADRPDQMFPAAYSSLVIVVSLVSMLLVWLCYDFGLPLLWNIGILSGLASARAKQRALRAPVYR